MRERPITVVATASAILLLLLLAACNDNTTDPGPARSFSGWVFDSISGVAIDSAIVSLNDTLAAVLYSDSAGYFQSVARADAARIYVRKAGYVTRWKDVVLGTNADSLLFELPPTTP